MANRTGEGFDRDELHEGDVLGASFINRLMRAFAGRIVGNAPVVVKPGNGVIAIGLDGLTDKRVVEKTILARLATDNGDGTYTWTPFSKGAAEAEVNISNVCAEVNGITGLTVGDSGTVVQLRKEIKIGDTGSKWFFAAGGSPPVFARITGNSHRFASPWGYYEWTQTVSFGGADKTGGLSGTAFEANKSTGVSVGTMVALSKDSDGTYKFWYPVAECGAIG